MTIQNLRGTSRLINKIVEHTVYKNLKLNFEFYEYYKAVDSSLFS
jgi:hypothetical protein